MTAKSSIWIDTLGDGDLSISVHRDDKVMIVGVPKRQARALANRILHEIDFAEGRRDRRPGTPSLYFTELQPCMDCGRKNAQACEGRAGRTCPLSGAA